MDEFIDSIDNQIAFNQGKNIFLDRPEMFRFINETIQAISNVNELSSDAEKFLVNYAADKAIEEFCRVNQYYSFDTESKNDLRRIYSDLFTDIRSGMISVESISKNHYKKLQDWIKACNPFAEIIYKGADLQVEPVACSEYSPDLQIEILQIERTQLKEPVLDIGCGKEGNLVNYLCCKGIDACGIDRFSFTSNNLSNFDWLEYDYGVEKWGTVISNLGFSNHFKHHHLREDGNYIGYAKKYMEILRSLKLGGRFYYAPDLPFIEQYLDSSQFRIDQKEIGEYDFKTTVVTRLK